MIYSYELVPLNDIRNVEWNNELIEKLKYTLYILEAQNFGFELYFKNREARIFIFSEDLILLRSFMNSFKNIYPVTNKNADLPAFKFKHTIFPSYATNPLFVLDLSIKPNILSTLFFNLDHYSNEDELLYQVLVRKVSKFRKNRKIIKKYVKDAYYERKFLKYNHWVFEVLSLFDHSSSYYRSATSYEQEIGAKMQNKLNEPLFETQITISLNSNPSQIISLLKMFRDPLTGQYLSYKVFEDYTIHREIFGKETMIMCADELIGFLNIPVPNDLKLGYELSEI